MYKTFSSDYFIFAKTKNKLLYRIAHITLAFLLLLSSTGIVLNKHYCGSELKSMAVFMEAEPCHHVEAMKGCPIHSSGEEGIKKKKKSCCNDETEYVKSDEEQLAQPFRIDLKNLPVLLAATFLALDFQLPATDSNTLHYLTYKPPIVLNDISVLLQVFRL